MSKQNSLYVFIRNTIFLILMFLVISSIIIEKGKKDRGEKSIFNKVMIKHNNKNTDNYNTTTNQNSNALNNKTIQKDSTNYTKRIISYLYINPESFFIQYNNTPNWQ